MASAHADSGRPDASVIVVGAGWAGLAAALRMAQAGLRCRLQHGDWQANPWRWTMASI